MSDNRVPWLLVIGAGPNQRPAIELAQKRGLRVVTTDLNPEAEGFQLAERHGVVSTRDVEGTLAFARGFHDVEPLAGVMTMASESAVTVARVSQALGLPGVLPEAAFLATHKIERQRCFKSHGVPSPRFEEARTLTEAIQKAGAVGWPVVVKPVDNAGARAVRRVNDPTEMADAVAEIRDTSDRPEILIEEFLQGSEHSIEGIVVDGRIRWTGFSDRNYEEKERYPPYFLEDGDTLPTILPEEMVRRIEEASAHAVRALGIDWGPVKGDIIVNDEGPKMLEMAARLSGDYFCFETVPLHNGTDLLSAVIDQSVGRDVDENLLKPKFSRGVALRYVWPQPGVVVSIRGVDEVRQMRGVKFFRWEPKWKGISPGAEITPARSMGERVASVLAYSDSREEAVRIAKEAVECIQIETDPRIVQKTLSL